MKMRRYLMILAAAVLLSAASGCAETGQSKSQSFHEHEAKELERIEGVGHAQAEREATMAEEAAREIQRSGIKTGG